MIPTAPSAVADSTGARAHRRNYGLDLFRAVAITMVVMAHFSRAGEVLGGFGVELFFVLSGFLIGGIFWQQMKAAPNFGWSDLKLFLHRRWMRTLPNYFLFFAVNLLLAPFIGQSQETRALLGNFDFRQIGPYLIFLQNFAWPISGFYGVSWSLAVEEWFYLLFPFAVLLLFRLTKSRKTAFICVTATLMVLPFVARLMADPAANWSHHIRTVVIFRLDALMFGVALALLKSERAPLWPRLRLAFWPASAGCIALLWWMSHLPQRGHGVAVAVLFGLLPLACAALIPFVEALPRPRGPLAQWVENISQWSYSIYLAHIPILFTFYHFTDPLRPGFLGKLAVKIVALTCVLAVSALVYRYFERPIMARRRHA